MTFIFKNLFASLLLLRFAGFGSTNITQSLEKPRRPDIVSFKSLDKHVLLGLDLVVPFLTMPVGKNKDKYGNERALINIDITALIVSGLVTGGSIVVGHLFRTHGIVAQTKEEATKRAGKIADANILEPFKLVYANAAGEKVETSLSQLFDSLEETFLEKDIDLSACMHKSICTMVYESHVNLKAGKANGVDKIIDGLVNLQWFEHMLQHTTFHEAIDAGKFASTGNCDVMYPRCSWSAPHIKLLEIFRTYVKFT